MYIAHPRKFRQAFVDRWDEFCASSLTENSQVLMTPKIHEAINAFSFEKIYSLDAIRLADDPYVKPILVKWFNDDPGPAPIGVAPEAVQEEETNYIGQLIELYEQRSRESFANLAAVLAHPEWGMHLQNQRTRYFEAAEFNRYYRDSTPLDYLVTFKNDLYHGVVDIYSDTHKDGLERMIRVLSQAAGVQPAGILGRHARVPVKQGVCHHFANEGRLPWRR
jgi:hypothetical protein